MTASARSQSGAPPAVVDGPPRRSPWTFATNARRVLWGLVSAIFWRRTPRSWTGVRNAVLRGFGATVGRDVALHPRIRIEMPWHLSIGDGTRIGEGVILYSLGRITIGPRCLIGPYVHVCAGTHDYTSPAFDLVRRPITLEAGCVVLPAAFIGPGVTLARDTVVRERAGVTRSTEPGRVYEGQPARDVGPRGAAEDAPETAP